jgi:glutamine synthetase
VKAGLCAPESRSHLAARSAKAKAGVGELPVGNHIGIKELELERTAALEGDALRDYYIHYV